MSFAFSPPHAEELPSHFEDGTALYQAPPENGEDIDVQVSPTSDNLQLLKPFEPWHEGQAENLSILIKVRGDYFPMHTIAEKYNADLKLRQMHHRPHLPSRSLV